MVWDPKDISRDYLWEGTKRHSNGFRCKFVSVQNPKHYIMGDSHAKGTSAEKVRELVNKFQHGLVFTMSKVVLAENIQRQYNSAPKSEVVCVRRTKFDPVLASAGKPNMPEPPVAIAASMSINNEQHFDALALIQKIGETAPGGTLKDGQQRLRCMFTLIDGSKKEKETKARLLPVTIFANKTTDGSEPQLFQKLRDAFEKKQAVAFFHIQGKKSVSSEGSTWSFQSGFSFSCHVASSTEKGQILESTASELLLSDAEIVPRTVLLSRSGDDGSYADMEATETTCGLLKTILAKTTLPTVEVDASFWQINWCRVYTPDLATTNTPDGQEMCNKDGSRLWFQVKVEDETGYLTLFIREKASLALAAVESKEEFENAIATGTLSFPQKASIKVIRKSPGLQTPPGRTGSVAQPTGGEGPSQEESVRCYIVEAAEQAMQDTPSKRSFDLITLLSMTDQETNACVPAKLGQIAKDPHYGLSVSYDVDGDVVIKQCTKAIALIFTSTPTKSNVVNDGYQMSTDGVQDPFTEGFVCNLLTFCTIQTSPNYQLKPNRGQKTQTAFVCIVDVLESGDRPVFLVEHVEKVEDSDAKQAPEHMIKRIHFAAMAAKMQGTSSSRLWTDEMSPASAGKCRRLGKAPSTPQNGAP